MYCLHAITTQIMQGRRWTKMNQLIYWSFFIPGNDGRIAINASPYPTGSVKLSRLNEYSLFFFLFLFICEYKIQMMKETWQKLFMKGELTTILSQYSDDFPRYISLKKKKENKIKDNEEKKQPGQVNYLETVMA